MSYRELIVKNHQIMSFTKIFAAMEPGQDLFWPGCAVLSLENGIVEKTYSFLKAINPKLSYSTFCCGKPSLHIYGGKDFEKKVEFIEKSLKENGTKNIYTLCPNCYVTLSEHSSFNVKSIWSLIDENFPEEKYNIYEGKKFSLHDPCPIVKDIEATIHVRSILKKMGAKVLEFRNNKDKTLCCGKKNMLMALEPEKGTKIFELRASQAPSNNIVTYCASCMDTFKQNSFNAYHVLELLFNDDVDNNTNSSWVNRYKTVNNLRKGKKNA